MYMSCMYCAAFFNVDAMEELLPVNVVQSPESVI